MRCLQVVLPVFPTSVGNLGANLRISGHAGSCVCSFHWRVVRLQDEGWHCVGVSSTVPGFSICAHADSSVWRRRAECHYAVLAVLASLESWVQVHRNAAWPMVNLVFVRLAMLTKAPSPSMAASNVPGASLHCIGQHEGRTQCTPRRTQYTHAKLRTLPRSCTMVSARPAHEIPGKVKRFQFRDIWAFGMES